MTLEIDLWFLAGVYDKYANPAKSLRCSVHRQHANCAVAQLLDERLPTVPPHGLESATEDKHHYLLDGVRVQPTKFCIVWYAPRLDRMAAMHLFPGNSPLRCVACTGAKLLAARCVLLSVGGAVRLPGTYSLGLRNVATPR